MILNTFWNSVITAENVVVVVKRRKRIDFKRFLIEIYLILRGIAISCGIIPS